MEAFTHVATGCTIIMIKEQFEEEVTPVSCSLLPCHHLIPWEQNQDRVDFFFYSCVVPESFGHGQVEETAEAQFLEVLSLCMLSISLEKRVSISQIYIIKHSVRPLGMYLCQGEMVLELFQLFQNLIVDCTRELSVLYEEHQRPEIQTKHEGKVMKSHFALQKKSFCYVLQRKIT